MCKFMSLVLAVLTVLICMILPSAAVITSADYTAYVDILWQ